MRRKRTVGVLLLAGLLAATFATALSARADGVPTGFVRGTVYLGEQPLAGVEVWLGGADRYTCTDENGSFVYKVVANEPFPAATGPSLLAGCSNAAFLDPVTGLPLVAQYYDHHDGAISGDTLTVQPGGEVSIRFDVHRAAATQLVELQLRGQPHTGVDWVMAFDRGDPAFVAAFGRVPRPSQYEAIWTSGTGAVAMAPVRVPWNPVGVAEVRYAAVGDLLVLAKEGVFGESGAVQGRIVDSHTFRDANADGVLEGPTLHFNFD